MEKLIKIDNENYPEFYNEKVDKYIYVNSDRDILGLITIDNSRECNKIKINVMDEFQGNGYGKIIFQKALDEYKMKYTDKNLRFEVNDESRLNNILCEFGGVNIANNNGTLVYVLPLNNE